MGKLEYSDFFFGEAIYFKIIVAGEIEMEAKMRRFILGDRIFQTDAITSVILSSILIHIVLNQ